MWCCRSTVCGWALHHRVTNLPFVHVFVCFFLKLPSFYAAFQCISYKMCSTLYVISLHDRLCKLNYFKKQPSNHVGYHRSDESWILYFKWTWMVLNLEFLQGRWGWKSSPDSWILELVQEHQHAPAPCCKGHREIQEFVSTLWSSKYSKYYNLRWTEKSTLSREVFMVLHAFNWDQHLGTMICSSKIPVVVLCMRAEELCKMPYVDSSKVYLTGVSMGGSEKK